MTVRRIVDLSRPLDAGTPVYPGDPPVRFSPHARVERDGFNLLRVEMGSQSGTHADAPFHFLEGGARIDEVDPTLFVGPGVVVDVRHRGEREAITAVDVEPWRAQLVPGVVVVLWTGWSERYGTAAYLDHPYLGEDACRVLLDAGVRTIGLDTPSIDETPDDEHPGAGFGCHLLVAGAGGIVVENLARLEEIDFAEPFFSLLPLRLTGADGAPVRAVAMDLAP